MSSGDSALVAGLRRHGSGQTCSTPTQILSHCTSYAPLGAPEPKLRGEATLYGSTTTIRDETSRCIRVAPQIVGVAPNWGGAK